MELIEKYFPGLDDSQRERFRLLKDAYTEWNARINVISRKDIDSLYLKHVLHSLAIARVCRFDEQAEVLDVGCGGGFPSVPLAIMFPRVRFTSVDSIGKKITVLKEVCRAAGIDNIDARNARVESIARRFDYAVSRAVTDMSTFAGWVWPKLRRGRRGDLDNGILYLKGGDLTEEMLRTRRTWHQYDISDYFDEEFFSTKKVVYIPFTE